MQLPQSDGPHDGSPDAIGAELRKRYYAKRGQPSFVGPVRPLDLEREQRQAEEQLSRQRRLRDADNERRVAEMNAQLPDRGATARYLVKRTSRDDGTVRSEIYYSDGRGNEMPLTQAFRQSVEDPESRPFAQFQRDTAAFQGPGVDTASGNYWRTLIDALGRKTGVAPVGQLDKLAPIDPSQPYVAPRGFVGSIGPGLKSAGLSIAQGIGQTLESGLGPIPGIGTASDAITKGLAEVGYYTPEQAARITSERRGDYLQSQSLQQQELQQLAPGPNETFGGELGFQIGQQVPLLAASSVGFKTGIGAGAALSRSGISNEVTAELVGLGMKLDDARRTADQAAGPFALLSGSLEHIFNMRGLGALEMAPVREAVRKQLLKATIKEGLPAAIRNVAAKGEAALSRAGARGAAEAAAIAKDKTVKGVAKRFVERRLGDAAIGGATEGAQDLVEQTPGVLLGVKDYDLDRALNQVIEGGMLESILGGAFGAAQGAAMALETRQVARALKQASEQRQLMQASGVAKPKKIDSVTQKEVEPGPIAVPIASWQATTEQRADRRARLSDAQEEAERLAKSEPLDFARPEGFDSPVEIPQWAPARQKLGSIVTPPGRRRVSPAGPAQSDTTVLPVKPVEPTDGKTPSGLVPTRVIDQDPSINVLGATPPPAGRSWRFMEVTPNDDGSFTFQRWTSVPAHGGGVFVDTMAHRPPVPESKWTGAKTTPGVAPGRPETGTGPSAGPTPPSGPAATGAAPGGGSAGGVESDDPQEVSPPDLPTLFPPSHRLDKPIRGTTGAEIIGYRWMSMTEEGTFRDRKVSDWAHAQTSEPTGRRIVHLFLVRQPDGTEVLMGVGAASKALGKPPKKMYTIAEKEQKRQEYRRQVRKQLGDELVKSHLSDTALLATRTFRLRRRSEEPDKFLETLKRSTLLRSPEGKFYRTIDEDMIEELKSRGFEALSKDQERAANLAKPAEGPATPPAPADAGEADNANGDSAPPATTTNAATPVAATGKPKAGEPFPVWFKPGEFPILEGKKTVIRLANGERREAVYVVVDASKIQPSHLALDGFKPNPLGDFNERPYEHATEGRELREGVRQSATNVEPDLVINTSPTATDGPPITSSQLIVLGGNSRAMMLTLMYDSIASQFEPYQDYLVDNAAMFGIDPAQIRRMEKPVLVRRLVGDSGVRGEMSRILNESTARGRTADTDAVSRGRLLTQAHIDQVAALFRDEGDTLATILADPNRAATVLQVFASAGALSNADMMAVRESDGSLTPYGKQTIQNALLGAAIGDLDVMSATADSVRQKLLRALASISRLRASRVNADAGGIEFDTLLQQALDCAFHYRDSNARSMIDLLTQTSFLPQTWRANPRAVALADSLINEGPIKFAQKMSELARIADDVGGGQAGFAFGQPQTPAEAFDDLFNVDRFATRATTGGRGMPVDLFGRQYTEAATGKQLDLPMQIHVRPDPNARREGESVEDYRIRMKFRQAEANTGNLFGDTPVVSRAPEEPGVDAPRGDRSRAEQVATANAAAAEDADATMDATMDEADRVRERDADILSALEMRIGQEVRFIAPAEMRADQRAIQQVFAAMGVTADFFDSTVGLDKHGTEGASTFRFTDDQGRARGQGYRIVLSAGLAEADLARVALHELLHSIARVDAALHASISQELDRLLPTLGAFHNAVRGSLEKLPPGRDRDRLLEKAKRRQLTVADIGRFKQLERLQYDATDSTLDSDSKRAEEGASIAVEALMTDPVVARMLGGQTTLWQRIKVALMRLLDRAGIGRNARIRNLLSQGIDAMRRGDPSHLEAKIETLSTRAAASYDRQMFQIRQEREMMRFFGGDALKRHMLELKAMLDNGTITKSQYARARQFALSLRSSAFLRGAHEAPDPALRMIAPTVQPTTDAEKLLVAARQGKEMSPAEQDAILARHYTIESFQNGSIVYKPIFHDRRLGKREYRYNAKVTPIEKAKLIIESGYRNKANQVFPLDWQDRVKDGSLGVDGMAHMYADAVMRELALHDADRGESFYTSSILERVMPQLDDFARQRYGRSLTPGENRLFHLLGALSSPNTRPRDEVKHGLKVLDLYMREDRLETHNPFGSAQMYLGHGKNKKGVFYDADIDRDKIAGAATPEQGERARATLARRYATNKNALPFFAAMSDADAVYHERALTTKARSASGKKNAAVKKFWSETSQWSKTFATTQMIELKRILDEKFGGDLEACMDWMFSMHTFKELESVYGELPATVRNEYLQPGMLSFGVYGLGKMQKLGTYNLNRLQALLNVTKDVWQSREARRLFQDELHHTFSNKQGDDPYDPTGTYFTLGEKAVGGFKRMVVTRAYEMLAERLGITPAEVQERTWNKEQAIYKALGAADPPTYLHDGLSEAIFKPTDDDFRYIDRDGKIVFVGTRRSGLDQPVNAGQLYVQGNQPVLAPIKALMPLLFDGVERSPVLYNQMLSAFGSRAGALHALEREGVRYIRTGKAHPTIVSVIKRAADEATSKGIDRTVTRMISSGHLQFSTRPTARATKDSMGFVLKTEVVIRAKMRAPAKAGDVQRMLKSNGVRDDELFWMGLDDEFARDPERIVTPEELLEWIRVARVGLQESRSKNSNYSEGDYDAPSGYDSDAEVPESVDFRMTMDEIDALVNDLNRSGGRQYFRADSMKFYDFALNYGSQEEATAAHAFWRKNGKHMPFTAGHLLRIMPPLQLRAELSQLMANHYASMTELRRQYDRQLEELDSLPDADSKAVNVILGSQSIEQLERRLDDERAQMQQTRARYRDMEDMSLQVARALAGLRAIRVRNQREEVPYSYQEPHSFRAAYSGYAPSDAIDYQEYLWRPDKSKVRLSHSGLFSVDVDKALNNRPEPHWERNALKPDTLMHARVFLTYPVQETWSRKPIEFAPLMYVHELQSQYAQDAAKLGTRTAEENDRLSRMAESRSSLLAGEKDRTKARSYKLDKLMQRAEIKANREFLAYGRINSDRTLSDDERSALLEKSYARRKRWENLADRLKERSGAMRGEVLALEKQFNAAIRMARRESTMPIDLPFIAQPHRVMIRRLVVRALEQGLSGLAMSPGYIHRMQYEDMTIQAESISVAYLRGGSYPSVKNVIVDIARPGPNLAPDGYLVMNTRQWATLDDLPQDVADGSADLVILFPNTIAGDMYPATNSSRNNHYKDGFALLVHAQTRQVVAWLNNPAQMAAPLMLGLHTSLHGTPWSKRYPMPTLDKLLASPELAVKLIEEARELQWYNQSKLLSPDMVREGETDIRELDLQEQVSVWPRIERRVRLGGGGFDHPYDKLHVSEMEKIAKQYGGKIEYETVAFAAPFDMPLGMPVMDPVPRQAIYRPFEESSAKWGTQGTPIDMSKLESHEPFVKMLDDIDTALAKHSEAPFPDGYFALERFRHLVVRLAKPELSARNRFNEIQANSRKFQEAVMRQLGAADPSLSAFDMIMQDGGQTKQEQRPLNIKVPVLRFNDKMRRSILDEGMEFSTRRIDKDGRLKYDDLGFHFKSAGIVKAKMRQSMKVKQVKQMLKSNGVSDEELFWSGLGDMLGHDEATVTPALVLNHISRDFSLFREEVTVGVGGATQEAAMLQTAERLERRRDLLIEEAMKGGDPGLSPEIVKSELQLDNMQGYADQIIEEYEQRGEIPPAWAAAAQAAATARNEYADAQTAHDDDNTSYGIYTEPGGINYTEARLIWSENAPTPGYRSSHWSENNVWAHYRHKTYQTTIDQPGLPKGSSVLHIAELQSDMIQALRDDGPRDTDALSEADARIDELQQEHRALTQAMIKDETALKQVFTAGVPGVTKIDADGNFESRIPVYRNQTTTDEEWRVYANAGMAMKAANDLLHEIRRGVPIDENDRRQETMVHQHGGRSKSLAELLRASSDEFYEPTSDMHHNVAYTGAMSLVEYARKSYSSTPRLAEALKDPGVRLRIASLQQGKIRQKSLETFIDRLSEGATRERQKAPARIPNADRWYETALRRIIRVAVDSGHDAVSLSLPDTHVRHYSSLGKPFDAIAISLTNGETATEAGDAAPTWSISFVDLENIGKEYYSNESRNRIAVMADGTIRDDHNNPRDWFGGQDVRANVSQSDPSRFGTLEKGVGKEMAAKVRDIIARLVSGELVVPKDRTNPVLVVYTGRGMLGARGMLKYYGEVYPGVLKRFANTFGSQLVTTDLGGPSDIDAEDSDYVSTNFDNFMVSWATADGPSAVPTKEQALAALDAVYEQRTKQENTSGTEEKANKHLAWRVAVVIDAIKTGMPVKEALETMAYLDWHVAKDHETSKRALQSNIGESEIQTQAGQLWQGRTMGFADELRTMRAGAATEVRLADDVRAALYEAGADIKRKGRNFYSPFRIVRRQSDGPKGVITMPITTKMAESVRSLGVSMFSTRRPQLPKAGGALKPEPVHHQPLSLPGRRKTIVMTAGNTPEAVKDQIEVFRQARREGRPMHEVVRGLSYHRMINDLGAALNMGKVGTNIRGYGGGILGFFRPNSQDVRLNLADNYPTQIHEVGHYLHELLFPEARGLNRTKGRSDVEVFPKAWRRELVALGKALYGSTKPAGGYASEGWAETVRFLALDPAHLQRSAPTVFRQVTHMLYRDHPEVWNAIKRFRFQAQALQSMPGSGKLLAYMRGQSPVPTEAGRWWSNFRTQWEDRFHRASVLLDDLGVDRSSLGAERDPHITLLRAGGKISGHMQLIVEHGIFDPADPTAKKIGPSLNEILQPVRDRLDEWQLYMVAKRVREKRDQGFGGLFGRIGDAELDQIIKDGNADPAFANAAQQFQALNEWLVGSYAVYNHLLTPEAAQAIIDKNKHYITFRSAPPFADGEQRRGFGRRRAANLSSGFRRFKPNRGLELIDPLGAFVTSVNGVVERAQMNAAALAVVRLYNMGLGGAGRWLSRVPMPKTAYRPNLDQYLRSVENIIGPVGASQPAMGTLTGSLTPAQEQLLEVAWQTAESPLFFQNAPNKLDQNAQMIRVLVGGKPVFYEVKDKGLYDMLVSAHEAPNLVGIARVMSLPSRVLRAGATQLNPSFFIPNFFRDVVQAMLVTSAPETTVVTRLKGMAQSLAGGDLERMMLASGVDMSSVFGRYVDPKTGAIDQDGLFAPKTTWSALKGGAAPTVAGKARVIATELLALRWLSRINNHFERMTRAGEFQSVRRGRTDARAVAESAQAAADVTIDFTRAGTYGQRVNSVVTFFNVGVQGPSKIARYIKANPVRAAARLSTYIILPTLAAAFMNRDDEEYWAIPLQLRDRFWWVPLGPDDSGRMTYLKIPRPHGFGLLAVAADRLAAQAYGIDPVTGKRGVDNAWKGVGATVAQQTLPPISVSAVQPLIEVAAGYDFFRDKAIISRADEDLPVEDQGHDRASDTARVLSSMLGAGADATGADSIRTSPAMIDHLLYGYFAGLGRDATRYAIDPLVRAAVEARDPGALPPKPTITPGVADWPTVRSFYANSSQWEHAAVQSFYDDYRAAAAVHKRHRQLLERNEEQAGRYASKHAALLESYPDLNRLNTKMSELAKARRGLRFRTDISADEASAMADELAKTMVEVARDR